MSQNVPKMSLSPRQLKAVNSLLEGNTIQETALCAGVTRKTVSRWLKEPGFCHQLKAGETQVLERVSRQLVGMSERAVGVLAELLDNPAVPGAGVRRLTACNLLELCISWRELNSFEERLSALERSALK